MRGGEGRRGEGRGSEGRGGEVREGEGRGGEGRETRINSFTLINEHAYTPGFEGQI